MYAVLWYEMDIEGRYSHLEEKIYVEDNEYDIAEIMQSRLRDGGAGLYGHWSLFDVWHDNEYLMTYTMSNGKVIPTNYKLKEPRRSVRRVMVPSTASEKVSL